MTERIKNDKEHLVIIQKLGIGDSAYVYQAIERFAGQSLSSRAQASIFAELLYGPYLQREQKEVEKIHHYQELVIPECIDYADISGLSKELQQKLEGIRPKTIAQAALIQGMTPAALSILIFKSRQNPDDSAICRQDASC